MNDVPIIFIVILLIVIIVAYQSIAIAAENERFATFFLGRFQAYMGPGLVLKTNLQKLHRLAVGDIGVISGSGFVKFGEVDVPVSIPESIRVGDSVRGVRSLLSLAVLAEASVNPSLIIRRDSR